MRDAVICEPLRTAVGGFGGSYRDVSVADLAATVIKALIERSGIPGDSIDDVIFAQGYANGEAPALGRVAALDAGLPVTVPGIQVDRRCGSGLQAVAYAAMCVQTGVADLILAGGAESMSQAEYYTTSTRWGAKAGHVELLDRLARGRVTSGGRNWPVAGGMIETAENLRREFAISRERQDALALRSHQRAVSARESGIFDDELVPVTIPGRKGDVIVDRDEHPRADTSMESLAKLTPIMSRQDPQATVTAGNSSGQNDGAAVSVVTTSARADKLGLRPLARVLSWAVAGVEPHRMGIGPIPATAKALALAGLTMNDLDLIELNEAFAAQVLACTISWGLDDLDSRLNVHGSGISLGHPIGATGGRIMATMLRELDRREGRYALETMCCGGGQGIAAVFERVA